ncbi:MAG: arsenite methyltransferase [Acidobacteriia bacterium]|nr:arsenite methyltransferase [Terriglobia bacterium]
MPTATPTQERSQEIKDNVKQHYANAIQNPASGCCGTASSVFANDPSLIRQIGYSDEELKIIPTDAAANSFGCGNPLAFAELREGDVVVDIGSGAGIDCFIAAQKVGPTGRVIGVDMTQAMLERARVNAKNAGLTNVEFREGDAESLPLDDRSADWVISNCVINLAPDKEKVFREIARVLKPGGRISISDIVVGDLPWWIRRSQRFYASCLSGALHEEQYLAAIRAAGLQNVRVTSRFVYDETSISAFTGVDDSTSGCGCGSSGKNGSIPWKERMTTALLKRFAGPIGRRLAGQVTSIKVQAERLLPDQTR